MENCLQETLDLINADIAAHFPEMSDAETAIRTMRVNLTAMTEALCDFGRTGYDMPNEGVAGLCQGLMESLEWMLAKELVADNWKQIESVANGEIV